MSQDNFLYLFPHIPKTAGEFFKRNIECSNHHLYLLRTSFEFAEPFFNVVTKKHDFYRGKDHFLDYLNSLGARKNEIRCLAGHNAYYGIHEHFERVPRYITFFRDPVSRVISLYNYERLVWDNIKDMQNPSYFDLTRRNMMVSHFLVDGQIPDFEAWLMTISLKRHVFHYSMSDYLHYLGFIGAERDEASFTETLNKFYFVGITDSFEKDAYYLYRFLNTSRFVADKNASPPYLRQKDLSVPLIQKVQDMYQDDTLLYECALRENKCFKRRSKDFDLKVFQTKMIKAYRDARHALGRVRRRLHAAFAENL